ncbi:MAG: family 10 glycosylhydrolase [Clostridia bacterium]|nr:family 10 glycosylhydrolase [Clostridia bacterium]
MAVLGVWMWSRSIRLRGAEDVMSHCAAAGVTDVYFLVKGLLGKGAYRSRLVPMDGERDLLAEALEAAGKRNIRVHAWFTTCCDEQYVAAHPESGRWHILKGPDNQMVSLADEGYQAYMENAVREICRSYPLDGIHLDYIRCNHITSGWSEADLHAYREEGADPDRLREMLDRMYYREEGREEQALFDACRVGEPNAVAFARARRKQVVGFASRLREVVKSENSRLILTAALMPEGAYEDTVFADLHYGQNYTDAVGLYDYILPMAYTKSYDKDGTWLRMLAENCDRRGLKTVMGLQAFPEATGVSLREDISALTGTSAHGICLFREGSCCMGYVTGRELTVYNATEGEITGICAYRGEETAEIQVVLEPGAEKRLLLPFAADTLRVFRGETELSVFTVQK